MAGNLLPVYGTATTLACTLASLANSATVGRASTAFDNTAAAPAGQAIDLLVQLYAKTGSITPASPFGAYIYVYGTADAGSHYDDGVTGTDASFTPTSPPNLAYLGFLNMPATTTQYTSRLFSMAAALGGTLPQKCGVVVIQNTGGAFDATAGNFAVRVIPVYAQYT